MNKTCFISAGISEWYSTGARRFKASLLNVGAPADIRIWVDEWPPGKFSRHCIYTIKAAAFGFAIKEGYTTIVWGDASIQAIKKVEPFLDVVNAKGYWLGQSGYNAAQTCNDACLQYFGVTRDEAEKMHDSATGLFGVSIEHEIGRKFIERFIQAGRDEVFHGSRLHAKQSKDPRFLFARQDQSCATVIAGKMGMPLDRFSDFVRFRWDSYDATFHCEGL